MPRTLDPEVLRAQIDAAREHFQLARPSTSLRRLRSIERRIVGADDERPEIRLLLGRVLLSQASAQYEVTGDLDSSLALLAQAEQLAVETGAANMSASVRGQRGLLYLRAGRTADALRALDDAEAVIDFAEPSDQTFILLNRGALHLERGDLPAAAADLERCLAVAEAAGDQTRQWMARHNIGYVDFLAGRLPRAIASLEDAARLNPGEPHPISLLDQARVLREAGLVRDADGALGMAAEMFRATGLQQDLGETELVRAECALVEGDAKRARTFATSAQRRFARRQNLRWQRKAELLVLRCEREAVDEGRRAGRTTLRRIAGRAEALAAACLAEARSDLAAEAGLLGLECRLRAGEVPAGSPTLARPVRSDDPLRTRLQLREVRALAARLGGDRAAAAAEVRRGLTELGAYQHRFGSLDLRTASAVHGSALARLGLEVAVEDGRPASVFALVEQSRAVSTRLPAVRPPGDEATAALLAELRRVEEEARGLEGEPGAADALVRSRSRAAHLQRQIRSRSWELEGDRRNPMLAAPRLAHVREAADRVGTAFVSYARHRGRWVAVVVAGRRVELVDLADVAEVEGLARTVQADLDAFAMPMLPPPLLQAVRSSISAGLRSLDQLLLGPLQVAGRPVVVSCSGALVVLPWSLLPSRAGLPVVVTPSATSWLRSQSAAERPARPKVVSLAGPDLHRAAEEAKRVSDHWPGAELLTGELATTAAARAALEEADVVHVAAHGTHRQDSPLFSSVRLADGQLYAYEIDAADGLAPCVVLSACEAGLATQRPGDEGLGLTSVLLHLGAHSVLAGVARVRDDVAADVMERVHHNLAAGVDSASALAAAQAAAGSFEADAPPAPFVCFGASW